jgi:hypothetical protein
MYLPFIAESVMSDGMLSATQVGETELGWQAMAASLTVSTDGLLVASYKHRTSDLVERVVAQPRPGTQRRRQSRLRR